MCREMKSTLFTIPSHGGSGVPQTIVAMIQLPGMLACLCPRATALATANSSENGLYGSVRMLTWEKDKSGQQGSHLTKEMSPVTCSRLKPKGGGACPFFLI